MDTPGRKYSPSLKVYHGNMANGPNLLSTSKVTQIPALIRINDVKIYASEKLFVELTWIRKKVLLFRR